MLEFNYSYLNIRECVGRGAAGAQTCRSLGHHLLHPLIFRLLVLCAPADFGAQSSLLQNRLHPQIQIPNTCPEHTYLVYNLETSKVYGQQHTSRLHEKRPFLLWMPLLLKPKELRNVQSYRAFGNEGGGGGQGGRSPSPYNFCKT